MSLTLIDPVVIATLPLSAAGNTRSMTIPYFCVFWREFMSVLAMCFRFVMSAVQLCFGQNLLKGISALMSNCNRPHVDAMLFSKFSNVVFNAAYFYLSLFPRVSSLFTSRRPSAVFRRVIGIHVNSIKTHFEWTWPHVFEKRFEGMSPLLAHFNSAPAIVFVTNRICVIASLLHSAKTDVSGLLFFAFHGTSFLAVKTKYNTTGCVVQS